MKWKKPNLKQILLILLLIEVLAISYPVWSWVFPSNVNVTLNVNTRYNPTQALSTDSNNIYTIKTTTTANNISFPNRSLRIDKAGKQLWINITSGSNCNVNIWQWYGDNSFVFEYTTTGSYNTTLYTGDYGNPTQVTGADSYGYNVASKKLWFTTSPSSSQWVYILFSSYAFTFLGPYNETTGLRLYTGTYVTAHFMDGNSTETFFVNGTYNYATTHQLQYFSYALSPTSTISQSGTNYMVYNQSSHYDVLFSTYEADTDYEAAVTLTWNSTYAISNKATTGFRVTFGTVPSATEYLSWHVYRTQTTKERQYWRSLNENASTLYIFDDDLTTYTVSFLDLAGVLDEYPFVTAQRYVNGTLRTVEKRMVDEDKKIQMNLKETAHYDIIISDGTTWVFGDVIMTGVTSFTLTLKGLEFPSNIILAYKYVRMYADRHNNLTSVSMVYQDTLLKTTSVNNTVYYQNTTKAYTNLQVGVNSFNVTWTSANYNLSYYAVMTSTHSQFGELVYRTVLPRGFSTNPWSLDWLGSLPFSIPTNILIPLFIVLCSMGVFSQRNAYVGMFIGVAVTGLLVWIGWLPVATFPWAMIIAALMFTLLFALGRKRRTSVTGE